MADLTTTAATASATASSARLFPHLTTTAATASSTASSARLFPHLTTTAATAAAVAADAELSFLPRLKADGGFGLSGSAWLDNRAHDYYTFSATGFVRVGGLGAFGVTRKPIRLRTGETYAATDGDGWTTASVTPPAIREDA